LDLLVIFVKIRNFVGIKMDESIRLKIKWGFVAVIILEIGCIFYALKIYNKFVSNPDNYYKNILNQEMGE